MYEDYILQSTTPLWMASSDYTPSGGFFQVTLRHRTPSPFQTILAILRHTLDFYNIRLSRSEWIADDGIALPAPPEQSARSAPSGQRTAAERGPGETVDSALETEVDDDLNR